MVTGQGTAAKLIIYYYSLSKVLVNLDFASNVFVIVCFCGSLLMAGSMVSSYVRTAKFILSSSHTELSPRRYRISRPVCLHISKQFTHTFILSLSVSCKEKESYRCAIKETIKSMLAFGWTIERTKEGEARDVHTCTRRVSQSGQQV